MDTLVSWSQMHTYIPIRNWPLIDPRSLFCVNALPKHHADESECQKLQKPRYNKNDIYSLQEIGNPSQFSSLYEMPLHEQNTFNTALCRRLNITQKTKTPARRRVNIRRLNITTPDEDFVRTKESIYYTDFHTTTYTNIWNTQTPQQKQQNN